VRSPTRGIVCLAAFVLCPVLWAGGKKGPKAKPLPDRYGKLKLGASVAAIERKITPVYKNEPAPDVLFMILDLGGKDVDAGILTFFKGKLAGITLIFQPQFTPEKLKKVLVKKHGLPTKEEPMETMWADSVHVMTLKHEYNALDKGERMTVTYGDLNAYQEMVARGARFERFPWKRGKKDVPPK